MINRSGEGGSETTPEFQAKLESSKGGGQSLDDSTRSEMVSKMGADFSGVKIHSGGEANQMNESINAKAFTHGQDIYFKDGLHTTSTNEGKELLAHELVHTVQQAGGKVQPKIQRQDDIGKEVDAFIKKYTVDGKVNAISLGRGLYSSLMKGKEAFVIAVIKKLPDHVLKGQAVLGLNYYALKYPDVTIPHISHSFAQQMLVIINDYTKKYGVSGFEQVAFVVQVTNFLKKIQPEAKLEDWVGEYEKYREALKKRKKGEKAPEAPVLSKTSIGIINKNRKNITDHSSKMKITKTGSGGIVYGGKSPTKEVVGENGKKETRDKPDEFYPAKGEKPDPGKTAILEGLRKELLGEGHSSSVQTWDDEGFTWGLGLASGGLLGLALEKFVEKNTAHKKLLKDVGVYFYNKEILVVDVQDGSIKKGEEAGHVIEREEYAKEKPLLNFFVELGENEKTAFDAFNAQWEAIRTAAASVPDYAWTWPVRSVCVLAHLSHWLPGPSWRKGATYSESYKGTNGDLLKIVIQYAVNMNKSLKNSSKRGSFIKDLSNGATVLFSYMKALGPLGKGTNEAGIGVTTLKASANHYSKKPIDEHTEKIDGIEDFLLITSGTEYYVIPNSDTRSVSDSNAAFDEIFKKIPAKTDKVDKKSLDISQPTDPDEIEADDVARKVVSGQEAEVKTAGATVNAKSEGSSEVTPEFQSKLESSKSSGQPLDDATRSEMESKMGADFSGVKVHTGSDANQMNENVNAKAFAHEQDIYFKNGQYNPSSNDGKELLAHELTHTVQQNGDVIRRNPGDPPTVSLKTEGEITAITIRNAGGKVLFTKKYTNAAEVKGDLVLNKKVTGDVTLTVTTTKNTYTETVTLDDVDKIIADFSATSEASPKQKWEEVNKPAYEAIKNGDDTVLGPIIEENKKYQTDNGLTDGEISAIASLFGLKKKTAIDKEFVLKLNDWQFQHQLPPTGKLSDIITNEAVRKVIFDNCFLTSTESSLKERMAFSNNKVAAMIQAQTTTTQEIMLIKSYIGNVVFNEADAFDMRETVLLAKWQYDNGLFPSGYLDDASFALLRTKVSGAAKIISDKGMSGIGDFENYDKLAVEDEVAFVDEMLTRELKSNSDYALWILDASRIGFLVLTAGGRPKQDLAQIALQMDFKTFDIAGRNPHVFKEDWSTTGEILNGMMLLHGVLKYNIEQWKQDPVNNKKQSVTINSLATWRQGQNGQDSISKRSGRHGTFHAIDFGLHTVAGLKPLLSSLPAGTYSLGIPWQSGYFIDYEGNRHKVKDDTTAQFETYSGTYITACNTAKSNSETIDTVLTKLANLDALTVTPAISSAVFGVDNAKRYKTEIDKLVAIPANSTARASQKKIVEGIKGEMRTLKTTNDTNLTTNKTTLESMFIFVQGSTSVYSPLLGTWNTAGKKYDVTYPTKSFSMTTGADYLTTEVFDELKGFNVTPHKIRLIFPDNAGHLHVDAESITAQ